MISPHTSAKRLGRDMYLDPPILQVPRQRFGFDDRQKLVKHFQVSARASGFELVVAQYSKERCSLRLACRRCRKTTAKQFHNTDGESSSRGDSSDGVRINETDDDEGADDENYPLYKPGIVTELNHRQKMSKHQKTKQTCKKRSEHNKQYLHRPVTKEHLCPYNFTVQWSIQRNEWFIRPGLGCRHHSKHDRIDRELLPFRKNLIDEKVLDVARDLGNAMVPSGALKSYLFQATGQLPTYAQADCLKLPVQTPKPRRGQSAAQAHVQHLQEDKTASAVFLYQTVSSDMA